MRSNELELIDQPLHDVAEVEENLGEMESMLRFIGIGRGIYRHFKRLRGENIRILDVGAGSGWIARMLRDAARKNGITTEIVALDISPMMLDCAQRKDTGGMHFTLGDARNLKFQTNAFDFAYCSAMLHHMSNTEALRVIREIDRVTSQTWVVCDLRRSALTYSGAKLLTRLISRNRLTLHDGPLSAKRSFSLKEFKELAAEAPGAHAESWGPFCMALVCAKS